MKLLSVASEVFPLIKTGGLADVAGALPGALAGKGVTTRTLLPGYLKVMAAVKGAKKVMALPDLFGGEASVLSAKLAGLDLLVLDAPHLYDRTGGPYGDSTGKDWPDNWKRFAALSRAGADIAGGMLPGWQPDLVHVHDWQAALTLAYMRYDGIAVPGVITIHNIAFQGHFGASIFGGLGLPGPAMSVDGVEYYGGVGFLKAGIQAADAITTVSPTYAQEIRTAEFGMGLEGLINTRAAVLHGIVNGIDTDVWDPGTDTNIASHYSSADLGARAFNLAALEERFGLTPFGMLVTVVSRLTWQKGMDVLAESFDALVANGVRFAILGSGDAALEAAFAAAAARHPGRIGFSQAYDEPLSHLLQAGADAILVPSRFEPCGLTQLYGLRYGCVPIVTRTGGLADTVIDANDAAIAAGVATGYQFSPLSSAALVHAVSRAQTAFASRQNWRRIQKSGMAADVSWDRSAALYRALYDDLLKARP